MDKPLSSTDILEALDNKVKVMIYPDLSKYHDIDKLFGNKDGIVLLYPFKGDGKTEGYYGHWVLLMRNRRGNKNEIEFFNSYQGKPDQDLKLIDEDYKENNNMDDPHLTRLLLDSFDKGYNVEYNNHIFQGKGGNIQTCGRWAVVRFLMRDLNIDQFNDLVNKLKKLTNLSTDQLVVELTKEI